MKVFDDVWQLDALIGQPTLIVRPECLCLVDTGMASATESIVELVASVGRSLTELRHILLTHADSDHIGGLARLKRETSALVYASPHEADVIEGKAPSREDDILQTPIVVDRRVRQGDHLVGGFLRVVETPGHTMGHVSYYLDAHDALIAGDCLTNTAGLTGSLDEYTDDRCQATETVKMLADLAPTTILFGHGLPIVGTADVKLQALALSLSSIGGDHV